MQTHGKNVRFLLDGWGVLQEQNLSFMTVRVEQREGKRGWKDRVESICFEFNPVRLMICILRGKEKFFLFVLYDKQDRWLIIIMIIIILFWALNNIDYTWHIFRKETTDFNIN